MCIRDRSKAAQKISEAVAATGEVRRVLADLGDASKAAKDKAASAKETLSKASAGIDAADESLGQMGETATAMQKTLSDLSALSLIHIFLRRNADGALLGLERPVVACGRSIGFGHM